MKKLLSILLTFILLVSAAVMTGCGGTGADTTADTAGTSASGETKETEDAATTTAEEPLSQIRVHTLMGPTGMGMAKLMSDNEAGNTAQKYAFELASSPDQITGPVIQGKFDIAAVPVNLAAVLYNKTGGEVAVAGVNTLGVLYILENGDAVNSIEDLRGQKIYATGQGSTPEYTLRYILEKNNIDPDKDVTIEYLAEHAELATQMTSGAVTLGMLPEPNVTSVTLNNSDVRIALDLTAEWRKVADTDLVQGCIIVNKTFAEQHPQALKKFLEEYKGSVDFVNNNIDEAAQLCESFGIVPKAAVAKKAIPHCNIVLVTGESMKAQVSDMLNVLYEASASSVGGTLPGDAFYYTAE